MEEIGELLGSAIIFFYALAMLKFVFKLINKLFEKQLMRNDKIYIFYKKVYKFVMKYHSLFGFITILFILIHFLVQFTSKGLNIYGVIAGVAMIIQVLLGVYGTKVKHKFKYWSLIHKVLAAIILLMIIIHIG